MHINYRNATAKDVTAIAHLHARSWQEHYAGIWPASYLNGLVIADRQAVWQGRFDAPAKNQHVIIAEFDDLIVGFTCIFVKYDTQYGTLLDNLHVSSEHQGHGIGRQLMARAAKLAYEQGQSTLLYLWVLEGNVAARKFYERLQGKNVETTNMEYPEGTISQVCRYVWTDLKVLY